jgi:hypothetical protein
MRGVLIAAAALGALALAGCNDNRQGMATVSGVCKPFPNATTNAAAANATAPATALPAGDPSAALDDCLHRWGYALAASTDPANIVANAALAACTPSLTAWNQQSLTAGGGGAGLEAPSLLNGETTNPLAEHYAFAGARALFYVVQARAGHCAPPPLANGQPAASTAK